MDWRPLDPHIKRLFGFTAAAAGFHLVLILAFDRPAVKTPDEQALVLNVLLEKRPVEPREPAAPAPRETPGSSGAERQAAARERTIPAQATKQDDSRPLPSVRELLRDLPDVAADEHEPFPRRPEGHPIFSPDRTIPAAPDRQFLDDGVWRRRGVERHVRYASLDGRRIWIRHFDNGEMQVCEKPYDDLFDHGDDYWPFACDRPSR